jgi:SpoVK/Ycf46/Vps4 family AAA+-type ATPase
LYIIHNNITIILDELDEAARRRFTKRIYIPLPDVAGRKSLILNLLKDANHSLTDGDIVNLIDSTEGYSGADLHSLCCEAAMGPVREIALNRYLSTYVSIYYLYLSKYLFIYQSFYLSSNCLNSIKLSEVPNMLLHHFTDALRSVSTSVSTSDLKRYIDWNGQFGSFRDKSNGGGLHYDH